jgi:hypothetical protein
MTPLLVLIAAQLPAGAPPHYVGGSGKEGAAMLRALSAIDHKTITIVSEEGTVRIDIAAPRIRERQADLDWVLDGDSLSIRDGSHHVFYSGRSSRRGTLTLISKLTGRRVDPFTRAILLGRPPLYEILEDTEVRVAGSVVQNGIPAEILSADSKQRRTTIFLSVKDHLPLSIGTDSLVDGKPIATVNRRFAYAPIGPAPFSIKPLPGDKKLGLLPNRPHRTSA